jgi:hypothetical protein
LVSSLASYYKKVANESRIKGRMNLALLTAVPSVLASKEDDSPANIQKFEQAHAQIRKMGVAWLAPFSARESGIAKFENQNDQREGKRHDVGEEDGPVIEEQAVRGP